MKKYPQVIFYDADIWICFAPCALDHFGQGCKRELFFFKCDSKNKIILNNLKNCKCCVVFVKDWKETLQL